MSAPADATVVFVAGYAGSEPGHWQRLWHESMPASVWVEQADWHHPVRDEWIAGLQRAVADCPRPLLFVAHSLGALTVAEWSAEYDQAVHGALLVAVPDPASRTFPASIKGYGPPMRTRLRFPAVMVASSDDPYMTLARSRDLARDWGCQWVNAGARGHLNAASGLGDWPEGRSLLSRVGTRPP